MEDRTFIVWSTGAVRAERIDRLEVREQRVTLLLNCGKELTVPDGDLDDVRKQLGLGAACAAAAAMSAPIASNQAGLDATAAGRECVEVSSRSWGQGELLDFRFNDGTREQRRIPRKLTISEISLAARTPQKLWEAMRDSEAGQDTQAVYDLRCVKVGDPNGSGGLQVVAVKIGDVTRRITRMAAMKLAEDLLRCFNQKVLGAVPKFDEGAASEQPRTTPARKLPPDAYEPAEPLIVQASGVKEHSTKSVRRPVGFTASELPPAQSDEPRYAPGRKLPTSYADAKLRCILGPDDDGCVGLGFDFPVVGTTIRVRISADHAAWLASQVAVAQPQRSQSPSSTGIPSFEVSTGGDVECTAPNAKSSAACQASS